MEEHLQYIPNQIIFKPGENAKVKTQVKVDLPDRIFATLVVLPSIQMLGLKLQNVSYSIKGTQMLTLK